MMNPSQTPGAMSLVLADSLDMTAAAPLKAQLLEARGTPLSLDAASVRRLGGQCLHVPLPPRAAWPADGHEGRIAQASDEFAEAVRLMGCADLASDALTPSDFAPL